jgi:hypothetical protein
MSASRPKGVTKMKKTVKLTAAALFAALLGAAPLAAEARTSVSVGIYGGSPAPYYYQPGPPGPPGWYGHPHPHGWGPGYGRPYVAYDYPYAYPVPVAPPPQVVAIPVPVPVPQQQSWGQPYQVADGRYCREYTQQAIVGGQPAQLVGHACMQPDGTWQKVD